MDILDKIKTFIIEAKPGTIQLICNKCGKKFKTKMGDENLICPKCGSFDTKITHLY